MISRDSGGWGPPSKVRVALARNLDLPMASKLVRSARQLPLWLATSANGNDARRTALTDQGAELLNVASVQDKLWLPSVMEALVARGITRLLVEGGPRVWRAFADASLIDEVVIYLAPPADPGIAPDDRAREAIRYWLGSTDLAFVDKRRMDPDTMWRFRRIPAKEGS